ncbi:MAG: amidohydrolase family protein [Desulfobacteraceae bacterium]|nr:amidohydrolase family protein [Desulfobacteraceae bacterium]
MGIDSPDRMDRRDFLKISSLAALGIIGGCVHIQASTPTAQLVLTNGKIITVDPSDSIAEAVAVKDGKILDVGDAKKISMYIGNNTQIVDLNGKTVTPGLIDAHAHLPFFGLRENGWLLNLQGIRSKEEILETLAQKTRKTPKGEWVSAWGVESMSMSYLNKEDLDRVSRSHPMLVVFTGGQWGFANSFALKIAGIDKDTPDPPGGRIGKSFSDDAPDGSLANYPALNLVRKHMPLPNDAQSKDALLYAAGLYAAEGVTTVHDNFFSLGTPHFHRAYFDTIRTGQMPLRIKIWPYIPNSDIGKRVQYALFESDERYPQSKIKDLISYKREYPQLFNSFWGGFKMAVDGAGGGLWYFNPYAIPLHKPEELRRMFTIFHEAGHQVSVHAVGNQAVDQLLDAIEVSLKEHPRKDHRHRIEHALGPRTNSIERMKRLGVVVCTHPQWLFGWGDKWQGLQRREDQIGVIPLRSYLKAGITVAIGADPPAFPLYQPQVALWQAGARVTRDGYRYDPSEGISIQEALRAQTMGGAYAGFQEKEIGSIEKGKQADMVVWDRDFYTIPQDEIRNVKAEVTMVGGKIVHKAEETTLS